MLRFVKSTQSADPQARMEVEAQLRATNQLLAARDGASPNEEAAPDLMNGQVISVKEEWSLVVEQPRRPAGSETRDAATSGAGREDDRDFARGGCARENQWRGRSGIDSERVKIKVGDRLQVDARQNVSLK